MDVLRFMISLILVTLAVNFQLRLLRLTNTIDKILTVFVLTAANLVFVTVILSELLWISPLGYLVFQFLIAILSYVSSYFFRKHTESITIDSPQEINGRASDRFLVWVLIGLFVSVALITLTNIFLGISLPPNNWDSMTYHLSRVGYWVQNGTLHHYYTNVSRQNFLGQNAEILILWTITFLKRDFLAASVQGLCYCGVGVTIYRISQVLGNSFRASLFAALVFLTLPMVVLQSSTTQNDLVVTFFAVTFYYFYQNGLKLKNSSYLLVSGLALGLAIGTKGTIFFMAPALALSSILLAVIHKVKFSFFVRWLGFCVTGIILLGSYNYIQNLSDYRNPLGPQEMIDFQQAEDSSVGKGFSNAIRYIFKTPEWTGLPMEKQFDEEKKLLGKRYLSNITATHDKSENFFSFEPDYKDASMHEDLAWFGFLGFFLFFPTMLLFLFQAIDFRRKAERWTYAFIPIIFFVFFCYSHTYFPFNGRFFVLPVAFVAPLVASLWDLKIGQIRVLIVSFVAIIAAWTAFYVTTHNARKPLLGDQNIFGRSYEERRAIFGNPETMLPFLRFLDEYTRSGTRVGLVLAEDIWDYIFFGKNFSRVVIPIGKGEMEAKGIDRLMDEYSLDYFITCMGGQKSSPYFGLLFNSNVGHCNYLVVPKKGRHIFPDWKTYIVIYRVSTGAWSICPFSGSKPYIVASWGGDSTDKPVPGDYDGDKKVDIAFYRSFSGLWFIRRSSDGGLYSVAYGGPGYIPIPGDYDGDGKTDIAVYHPASGLWFIKKSSDGSSYHVGNGGANYVPVLGDYDGDGKTDITVYHPASGLWFIKKSSDRFAYHVGYGGANYVPVPGDYDGDGKTDVAVYHSTSGLWFVKKSSDGNSYSVTCGGADYTPVPGDYDGDGKTDVTVYHASTGYWRTNPSTGGTPLEIIQGGNPSDLPVIKSIPSYR